MVGQLLGLCDYAAIAVAGQQHHRNLPAMTWAWPLKLPSGLYRGPVGCRTRCTDRRVRSVAKGSHPAMARRRSTSSTETVCASSKAVRPRRPDSNPYRRRHHHRHGVLRRDLTRTIRFATEECTRAARSAAVYCRRKPALHDLPHCRGAPLAGARWLATHPLAAARTGPPEASPIRSRHWCARR